MPGAHEPSEHFATFINHDIIQNMSSNNTPSVLSSLTERIRIDVALVPAEPLFSQIIEASQKVTGTFPNMNIIDRVAFPPHSSLHICTIPKEGLSSFIEKVQATFRHPLPLLIPAKLEAGSAGYISLKLDISPEVRFLHEEIAEIAATTRGSGYQEDPVRLARMAPTDRMNFEKYGNSHVFDKFDLHMSIAKVSREHQRPAFDIARSVLQVDKVASAAAVQICDIGMRSEKWTVLYDSRFSNEA